MITAFVLIRARGNRVQALGEAIAELPQVGEVYSVTGPYDLVALVRLKDVEELDDDDDLPPDNPTWDASFVAETDSLGAWLGSWVGSP